MKKFIKNLKVIDRVMQFELDQIQLELGQLQSEIDQISRDLYAHQSQQQQERAWITGNPEYGMTFNSYEQWAQQSIDQMGISMKEIDKQINDLHSILVEKFQDSKKINQTLTTAKTTLKIRQSKEEQKVLDQLSELRFHLNKLKQKEK